MPELPEVETIVRDLNEADLIGQTIAETRVLWAKTLAFPDLRTFAAKLKGRVIETMARRGKYIVFSLSGGYTVLIHLRMTGRLSLDRDWPRADAHARMAWRVRRKKNPAESLVLCFRDPRKFGRVWLLDSGEPSPLDKLGVEPLSAALTVSCLSRALGARGAAVKTLLLDQTIIAGLGNIYVDEALWHAGLHPLRPGRSLKPDDIRRLRNAIRHVLQRALRAGGTSLGTGRGNFYGLRGQPGRHLARLKVYRRTSQPCPRCATPVERIVVAQRGTHLCPRCQEGRKAGS